LKKLNPGSEVECPKGHLQNKLGATMNLRVTYLIDFSQLIGKLDKSTVIIPSKIL